MWTCIRSPYSLLRGLGFSPQLALASLGLLTTTAGGVVVNETIFAEKSFSRGDPGSYSAPADIPTSYSDSDSTLRIDLGLTPVGVILIENISLGSVVSGGALPSGETSVLIVGGNTTSTGFTATWLEVGHLTLDRSRCTSLELSIIETHTLELIGNASDGQSLSPTPATPRRRAISGGNRADSMLTSGGTYDMLVIRAPTSGQNGMVDKLTLTNLFSKGGSCILSRIKAGTISILLNEIGAGNGFSTKEFVVASSTKYKILVNTDNVEVPISPPATKQ
jgi:hypothetical protein